jgi:hypothetical protein
MRGMYFILQLCFSTGSTIDSLYISGNVDDVLRPRKKNSKDTNTNDKEKPLVVGCIKQMQKIIKKSHIIFRE